jgi:CHASE2 domain-containing sensor protein
MFYAIDWQQILKGDFIPVLFEDKIVILGFMGKTIGDPAWNDKFFTPLNRKVAGRANPDMFGAVVHANIVAMILNEDYVSAIPEWAKWGIAIMACFLNVLLFSVIDRKLPIWFDALSVVLQIIQILLVSLLVVYFMVWLTVKLDLSLTLGVLAVVGPCFDLFKSFEREVEKRFTKPNEPVLT